MKNRYVEEMETIFFREACASLDALVRGMMALSPEEVYHKLYVAMQVKNTYYDFKFQSVSDMLLQYGYSPDEVERLKRMREKEKQNGAK